MQIRIFGYYFTLILFLYLILFCIISNHTLFKTSNKCTTTKIEAFNNFAYIGEDFDFSGDTLVLLHIQKTSGTTWENHILRHLQIKRDSIWEPACLFYNRQKRYICVQNNHKKAIFWDRYISRFCDIHADYTELKNCLMHDYKNRIVSPMLGHVNTGIAHLMTFLRDPVLRYISEFEHVKKGATWFKAVKTCKDQALYSKKCYDGDSWKNVTWNEFLSCEHNLANNRQTRMLANYNILGCNVLKCWTKSSSCSPKLKHFYEQKLLQSAKHTLIGLAFFGLTEYQQLSEYLFLKTFNENKFKFSENIKNINETMADASLRNEAKSYIDKIKENNHLDIQLYEFAKTIFLKRVQYFKSKDDTKKN